MYFLIEVCQNPGILRVLYFVYLLMDALFVIVPISLIIMLLVDFFKAVVSDDDTAKKNSKMAGKRIINAMLIFCVPWIVNVIMMILNSAGFPTGYSVCEANAKSGNFTYYDNLLAAEEAKAKAERTKSLEEKRKQYEAEIAEKERLKAQDESNISSGEEYSSMADALIGNIEGELGNTDSSKYGAPAGTPWCGYFVAWAVLNTEYDGINLYNDIIAKESEKSENSDEQQRAAERMFACALGSIETFYNNSNLAFEYSDFYANKYEKEKYTPKKGDIIYFKQGQDWDGEANNHSCAEDGHIGIVAANDNGNLTVYSRNSSDKVNTTYHSATDTNIVGYGSWYSN